MQEEEMVPVEERIVETEKRVSDEMGDDTNNVEGANTYTNAALRLEASKVKVTYDMPPFGRKGEKNNLRYR